MIPRIFMATLLLAAGCTSTAHPPLTLAGPVDLRRFMGDWYVIAATPMILDADAHNAVESYRLARDGTIAVDYTFRAGAFDGPPRHYSPRGFVRDKASNAVWGMQFLWPFESDYRIAYLADDYSQVVIAREKRDYAWIMARTPRIPDADYRRLLERLRAEGYDLGRIRVVPQRH